MLNMNSSSLISIVPKPLRQKIGSGEFVLQRGTRIDVQTPTAGDAATWFATMLYEVSGVRLLPSRETAKDSIVLRLDENLLAEEYSLQIAPHGVEISASDASGFVHAFSSLLQCIHFEQPISPGAWKLPAMIVRDAPRFRWRGLMLDSVRHFQPFAWVKKFIDAMALHKFNVLHWHLTDDQGWRVEIEKYPALTDVGAWRSQTRVGHERGASDTAFDGRPHGGFYSKEQLRDLVAYAAGRGITIVPEIEMPGHAVAALAAYPQFSCTGGPFEVSPRWGVRKDVYCAGNDEVFHFLEGVLEEVLEIFPSQFIHIGGDECPKVRWKECSKCQQRMQTEGLSDEHKLQSWFIRHFDRFLSERGRRLIGWDEILEGGLAKNAAVMSWRGEEGGITAARLGHEIVMVPQKMTYLDYYQSENTEAEPLAIGGCTPVEKMYSFEPISDELTAEQAAYVLGSQGQLWTEYMPHPQSVEYMAFPRACALAEVLWSAPQHRDLPDFMSRLRQHLPLLDRLNINYRPLDRE
jgi:hexosaminidase